MTTQRAQLMATLKVTYSELVRLTSRLEEEALDYRLDHDEWSVREILAHLVDDEMYVMRTRLERIIKENAPDLAPHDEKYWFAHRNTTRDDLADLLADFQLQRTASLAILNMLRESDWQRQGTQPEYGRFSAEVWLGHWVEHDKIHLLQIEKTLKAYR